MTVFEYLWLKEIASDAHELEISVPPCPGYPACNDKDCPRHKAIALNKKAHELLAHAEKP